VRLAYTLTKSPLYSPFAKGGRDKGRGEMGLEHGFSLWKGEIERDFNIGGLRGVRRLGMLKDHQILKIPKDQNPKIWRYMDFTKFVSILDKSALFFTRADKLGDPFEGSIPKLFGEPWPETDNDKKRIPSQIFKDIREYRIFLTKCTIINCWHINEYESAAMWKLYLKSNEGIAIQSSLGRLNSCFLDESFKVSIGKVEYVDYQWGWIPSSEDIDPFVYKRKCFEHERELRAIIQSFYHNKNGSINYKKSRFDDGAYIEVDLGILIENIFVAPTSPKWVFKLVKSTMQKYGLNKRILQSEMENTPIF
jgi:hypothetical protein